MTVRYADEALILFDLWIRPASMSHNSYFLVNDRDGNGQG